MAKTSSVVGIMDTRSAGILRDYVLSHEPCAPGAAAHARRRMYEYNSILNNRSAPCTGWQQESRNYYASGPCAEIRAYYGIDGLTGGRYGDLVSGNRNDGGFGQGGLGYGGSNNVGGLGYVGSNNGGGLGYGGSNNGGGLGYVGNKDGRGVGYIGNKDGRGTGSTGNKDGRGMGSVGNKDGGGYVGNKDGRGVGYVGNKDGGRGVVGNNGPGLYRSNPSGRYGNDGSYPEVLGSDGMRDFIPLEEEEDYSKFDQTKDWLTCFGAVVVVACVLGLIHSFAVFAPAMQHHYETGLIETVLVGCICYALLVIFLPVSGLILQCLEHRWTAIFGMLLIFNGLLLDAFTINKIVFYISHLLIGIGGSLAYESASTICSDHFRKRLAIALCAVTCAGSLGTIIIYFLSNLMLSFISYMWTKLCLALIVLVCMGACQTFPVRSQHFPWYTDRKDKERVKECLQEYTRARNETVRRNDEEGVHRKSLLNLLAVIAIYVPYLFLEAYAVMLGTDYAISLICWFCLASIVARIAYINSNDHTFSFNRTVFQVCCIGSGILYIFLNWAETYGWILVWGLAMGALEGILASAIPRVTLQTVPLKWLATCWTWTVIFHAVGLLIGPIVMLSVYYYTLEYGPALVAIGIAQIIAGILAFLLPNEEEEQLKGLEALNNSNNPQQANPAPPSPSGGYTPVYPDQPGGSRGGLNGYLDPTSKGYNPYSNPTSKGYNPYSDQVSKGHNSGAGTGYNPRGANNMDSGFNNGPNSGLNNSSSPGFKNNSGPGFNNNSGPGFNNNSGPGFNNSSGPGVNNSSSPGFKNNSGPGVNNSAGPGFKNSSGPGVNNSSGPGVKNSSDPGGNNNTGLKSSGGPKSDGVTGPEADNTNNTDDNGLELPLGCTSPVVDCFDRPYSNACPICSKIGCVPGCCDCIPGGLTRLGRQGLGTPIYSGYSGSFPQNYYPLYNPTSAGCKDFIAEINSYLDNYNSQGLGNQPAQNPSPAPIRFGNEAATKNLDNTTPRTKIPQKVPEGNKSKTPGDKNKSNNKS